MKTWNGFEKGINLGGWLSQWDLTDREHLETFITEQDIQDIRAMGADHVRLPVLVMGCIKSSVLVAKNEPQAK